MSALARFEHYLHEARRLMRREIAVRTAAGVAVVACVATVASVAWLLSRGFPESQVVWFRVVLIAAVVGTGLALFLPGWQRLRKNDGARELEKRLPAQGGRIDTLLDTLRRQRAGEPVSPLTELLALDAERVADSEPLSVALPARRRRVPAALAALAIGLLLALATVAPTEWAMGARHLWAGQKLPPQALAAARSLEVSPGTAKVRRNQDVAVSAQVKGVRAGEASLHVRYAGGEWETAAMKSTTDGKFDLTLFALREGAEYYVSAGGVESDRYTLTLVDLPKITQLTLRYDYPSWTGLPSRSQEDDGTISAVAGTRVAVNVEADAPLDQPLLVIDENSHPLDAKGTKGAGTLTVKADGHYRIAARFGDELVALTEDFPITALVDEKPVVEVVRPGRDYQASAIEEVPVKLRSTDDYRVDALELKYSVNGGAFQSMKVPAGKREIDTAAMLNLESLGEGQKSATGPQGLVPGDLVTYYAVARDHAQSAQTDLFMVQVQPFDRRYAQGQGGGGGGGGGGGDDQMGIAERQREILLATFNLTRDGDKAGRDEERRNDNAQMLSELQTTLRDQANTLVERTKARELAGADATIRQFVESLEKAAKEMDPAASRLAKVELDQAIPSEQRALQHLLRAEAAFRDIQVARQQGGGGGGGGGSAGRDVAEMTELELDLEKNQYETEQQLNAQNGGGASNPAQDEALRKLKELARRQEQLARENAKANAQPEASRWKQEQLRREAEQLRKQLEQLARQQNGGSQQQQQNGSQQQSGSQQGGSQGQSSGSQQQQQQANAQNSQQGSSGARSGDRQASAAADAARQLEQALAQMRNGEQQQQRQRGASPEEASKSLNRAIERLERGKQESMGDSFESLAREANDILAGQKNTEQQLGDAVRGFRARQQQGQTGGSGNARERAQSDLFGGLDYQSAERLAERKRALQERLEALQSQIQSAARSHKGDAPKAADKLARAGKDLEESQTSQRLARSALEIERGRTTQAASRDGIITEALENLQRDLQESATVASNEGRSRGDGEPKAGPDELLAELASLRRAVDEARERAGREGVARANGQGQQPGQGEQPGEGEGGEGQGQQPGQGGQQQGAQQPGGGQQGGQQPGGQAGGGARSGGSLTAGGGGGAFNGGQFDSGGNDGRGMWDGGFWRDVQPNGQRLQELRGRLEKGRLAEGDIKALQELSDRLRRGGGGDPMSNEYRRMVALVDQLELAALRAGGDASKAEITRGNARSEEPARYRENVAEYYRRLAER